MTECEHDDLEREAIPEFSLHEFWVCSCGEVIGLCEDSPYPRKSDLRDMGLLPTIMRSQKTSRGQSLLFPLVKIMDITKEEALCYLYLQRTGNCTMYDVPCVQLNAIKLHLPELVQAITLSNGMRYYNIMDNYEQVVEPIKHLLDEFIFKRGLAPL